MTEEATVPEQRTVSADEQALLRRLRAGENEAFSELFELHSAAVRRLARGIANDASEADDITAETFFRVLQALRRGSGPRDHIRAYLLTVARRVSWEWHGARRDVPVTDDELTHRAGAGVDAHARTAEHTLITTAFTSLPERWRTVLWETEVEGVQPAVVAPHFGLSANATAALARRARQGLRAAYLQAHLALNRTSDVSCRGVVEKLGGYTAGSVTGSEATRIRTHLLGCPSCRAMHAELTEVCSSLRAHAGLLAALVPAAAAGVASSGGGLLATVKGLVLSKLKLGIALASTTAVGVVGVTVGPALIDTHDQQVVGLPQSGIELRIAPVQPPLLSPPPQQPAPPSDASLSLPGEPQASGESRATERPTERATGLGQRQIVQAPSPSTASARQDPVDQRPSGSSSSSSTGARADSTTDAPTGAGKPGKGRQSARTQVNAQGDDAQGDQWSGGTTQSMRTAWAQNGDRAPMTTAARTPSERPKTHYSGYDGWHPGPGHDHTRG